MISSLIAADAAAPFAPGWNGQARTPPMGWRSWNAFGPRITQDMMMEAATAMTAKNRTVKGWDGNVSLCDLGYCSVGVDEGWEGCGAGVNGTQHDAKGIPTIDATFPDTAAMVKGIHALGLSAGWYLNGCKCGERTEQTINYEGDVTSLHDFDFDGVKIDGCGAQKNQTLYAALMKASGKNYTIENCHWGDCTGGDDSSCPTQTWCPWNWYRTSGDINSGAFSWLSNLQTTTRFQDHDAPLAVPGCWAYPDMLEVGRVEPPVDGAFYTWNRAHFGAWCVVSAPLILGLELTDAKLGPILDILGNKEAVAINQAWDGHPGMLVENIVAPPQPWAEGGVVVPSSSLGDFGASGGASLGSGRGDDASSGAGNIRTGGPGGVGLIRVGSGIVGSGHTIDSISLHFRYAAGYTPGPGGTAEAPTVSVQLLDMKTDAVLKTVWTSAPLGNYSWDHFGGYSPPVAVSAAGLGVKLSADAPVIVALSVANHQRNLQIPVDDKAAGFDIKVGFDGARPAAPTAARAARAARQQLVEDVGEEETATAAARVGYGLAPYSGSGVPFGAAQLWAKRQPHGAMAVLLINHGGARLEQHSVDLAAKLNLTAPSYAARDVWNHHDLGTVAGTLSLSVDAYDSAFVTLTPTTTKQEVAVERR